MVNVRIECSNCGHIADASFESASVEEWIAARLGEHKVGALRVTRDPVTSVDVGQQRAVDPKAPEGFAFLRERDGSLDIESAVFQALGAASVCWENMSGTGVFNSDRAKLIGDTLVMEISDQLEARGIRL